MLREFVFGLSKTVITDLFSFALNSVGLFLPEIAFYFYINASKQAIDALVPFNQIFLDQSFSEAFIIHVGIPCWTL